LATCARGLNRSGERSWRLLHVPGRCSRPGRRRVRGGKSFVYEANLSGCEPQFRILPAHSQAAVAQTVGVVRGGSDNRLGRFHHARAHLAVDCQLATQHYRIRNSPRVVKDAICDHVRESPRLPPERRYRTSHAVLHLHIFPGPTRSEGSSTVRGLFAQARLSAGLTKAPLNEASRAAWCANTGQGGRCCAGRSLCGPGTLRSKKPGNRHQPAPGLTRRHFGFMGWMDYDVQMWTELRDAAPHAVAKKRAPSDRGSRSRDAIEAFRDTTLGAVRRRHLVNSTFATASTSSRRPTAGHADFHPPYGEARRKKELRSLYRAPRMFRRLPG